MLAAVQTPAAHAGQALHCSLTVTAQRDQDAELCMRVATVMFTDLLEPMSAGGVVAMFKVHERMRMHSMICMGSCSSGTGKALDNIDDWQGRSGK